MSAIDLDGRSMPPVGWCSAVALLLVISGGVLFASYAPRPAPLALVELLLIAAALSLGVAMVMLARVRDFAWCTFRRVFAWALLAYVIVAGMIEFAILRDGVTGAHLGVVTLMLVIFAASVPLNIAYTTARFADAD